MARIINIREVTSTVCIGVSSDGTTAYFRMTGVTKRGTEYEFYSETIYMPNGISRPTKPHSYKIIKKGQTDGV
jgi:hypothetical protein